MHDAGGGDSAAATCSGGPSRGGSARLPAERLESRNLLPVIRAHRAHRRRRRASGGSNTPRAARLPRQQP